MSDDTPHHTTPYEGREVTNADLMRALSAQANEQKAQGAQVRDIHRAMYGDKADKSDGLIVQVDRLKETQKRQKMILRALGGGLLAAAGSWAWGKLTGKHG